MEGIGIFLFALLGMVVGSFLNVCIDRLPSGGSLVYPPSHCASCHQRLGIKDLIPVFSYLWLRGRCRSCHTTLPRRLLWIEIGTGVLFAYLYGRYGLTIELAVIAFYSSLFIVLLAIDLEHGLILNKIVYPAIGVALIISIFLSPSRVVDPDGAVAWLLSSLPAPGVAQAAIGGGIGGLLFLLIAIVSRGGMGWGDVKMAALIGAVTGYMVLVALFLAIIFGGLVAVALLLLKLKKRKEGVPFAPFLSLGAVVTLLWGADLLSWYLRLF